MSDDVMKYQEPARSTLHLGMRVQTHPRTSAWKRGDRYGMVVGYSPRRGFADVRLEGSGRTIRLEMDDLLTV